MKIVVWSYIFISFTFLFDYTSPPYSFDIEFGLMVVNRLYSDRKKLCIFTYGTNNSNDLRYLNRIITEIKGLDLDYSFDIDEEDSKLFFQKYFDCKVCNELVYQNPIRYMRILADFLIPDKCRLNISEDNDLSLRVIEKITTNLKDLGIDTFIEFLSFSCVCEMFYKDLNEYSGYVDNKEEFLSEISVLNDALRKYATQTSDKTPINLIVEWTHELMGTVLGWSHQPSMFVTLCLVSKSIDSYKYDNYVWILDNYVNMVKNFTYDESCDISRFPTHRRDQLLNISKNKDGEELGKIEKLGILYGLGNLFAKLGDTDVQFSTQMLDANARYFPTGCSFEQSEFMRFYPSIVTLVLNYKNIPFNIGSKGDLVIIFCMYSDIANHRQIEGEQTIMDSLRNVIDSYIAIVGVFDSDTLNYNLYPRIMTRVLRGDSKSVESYIGNSYLNKLILGCKLYYYKYVGGIKYDYLAKLHNYLYDYAFEYCRYHSSDLNLFVDGLSQNLYGFKNVTIVSLKYVKDMVDKMLDNSVDNNNVTWLNESKFEEDSCQIRDDVNYSLIHFEKLLIEKPDYEYIRKTIIPLCSDINSGSKVVSDYKNSISIQHWMLLFNSSKHIIQNESYTDLTFDEKFKMLKNYFYDELKSYKVSQGFQMRIKCEIRRIVKYGLPDLSSNMYEKLYLYLASKFPDNNCLLDALMFRKFKIRTFVAQLRLHPELSDFDNNKAIAYVLYLNYSFPNVPSLLTTYEYPEVIPLQIIDQDSCSYHTESSELIKTITTYLENKYKENKENWIDYVSFYRCLILKDTRTYLNDGSLSSKEIEDLKKTYETILTTNPGLAEINQQNINIIFDIITKGEEFKHYSSNIFKLTMIKCYIRKLHSHNIVISPTPFLFETSSSTKFNSEQSSNQIKDQNSKDKSTSSFHESSTEPVSKAKLSFGAIAGITIACIVTLGIISGLVIYLYIHRKNK